ncbi:DUF1295 domain protein [Aspergillus phoenicis ATCC 13157]|uniref:DUF1295 domain protein n=1 Tax=Aspergillus phoenicis ATCC 13157 TaxID=1353007 RepID=A0A370PBV1_ASPPH|nr:hypothetical protein CBS147346_1831 [Aspergillus niger]RDK39668.1 DUF1295 domain protein [Aspergillus phoenicis ATCC 13157]GLA28793.1 hypothetical protein AnigIFM63326_006385 [Aspergillus niger]
MNVSGSAPFGNDYIPHPHLHPHPRLHTADIGIFKSTILPSFTLHTTLDIAAFIASKATDRAEIKDWCWPSSQVINAWWSAIGHQVYYHNISPQTAWSTLSWTEKVLLTCVTVWGTRLFTRIASRTITRGKDDPRYDQLKKEDPNGFWTSALLKQYLPEAAFLTLIALPFTVPFRLTSSTLSLDGDVQSAVRAIGVALFGAGFALEVMADAQLELHRQERTDLCKHGVWSIVRHPNYLGDTLVHISFAVLNVANNFNPIVLLGPLTNYFFLRFVGGDRQTEASQETRYRTEDLHKYEQLQSWRREKNSFWPGFTEVVNPWTWVVLGAGVLGVVVEEGIRGWLTQ